MNPLSLVDGAAILASHGGLGSLATSALIWLSHALPFAVRIFAVLALQAPLRVVLGGLWALPVATLSLVLGGIVGSSELGGVQSLLGGEWLRVVIVQALVGLVMGAIISMAGYAFVSGQQCNWKVLLHGDQGRSSATLLSCALLWVAACSFGIHHVVLDALLASFQWLPVGGFSQPEGLAQFLLPGVGSVVHAAVDMSVLALGFAAPALLSGLLLNIGLRLLQAREPELEPLAGVGWEFLRCGFVLVCLASIWELRSRGWIEAVFALG